MSGSVPESEGALVPERVQAPPTLHVTRIAPRDPSEGRAVRDLRGRLVLVEARARRDGYFLREAFAWVRRVLAGWLGAGAVGVEGAMLLPASQAEETFEKAEVARAERIRNQTLLPADERRAYAEAAGATADAAEKLRRAGIAFEIDEQGRILVVPNARPGPSNPDDYALSG